MSALSEAQKSESCMLIVRVLLVSLTSVQLHWRAVLCCYICFETGESMISLYFRLGNDLACTEAGM